jgi:hypothetical protein
MLHRVVWWILTDVTSNMGAISTSETSVHLYMTPRRYIREDSRLYICSRENLKSFLLLDWSDQGRLRLAGHVTWSWRHKCMQEFAWNNWKEETVERPKFRAWTWFKWLLRAQWLDLVTTVLYLWLPRARNVLIICAAINFWRSPLR